MDKQIGMPAAGSATGKTKNEFIQQAHEAREARELTRRRDQATTVIQAFFKAVHVRRTFKKQACKKLDQIIETSSFPHASNVTLTLLRQILFVCDGSHDRNILDSLIQLILSTSSPKKITTFSGAGNNHSDKPKDTSQSLIEDAIKESIELSSDHVKLDDGSKSSSDSLNVHRSTECQNFVRLIIEESIISESSYQKWVNVLEKILILCLNYLNEKNSARLDSQHIDTYMQILNLFTSVELLEKNISSGETECFLPLEEKMRVSQNKMRVIDTLAKELFERTLCKRKDFFEASSTLICERINRFRNDLKASILHCYTQIVTRFLYLESLPQKHDEKQLKPSRESLVEIIISMLIIPGFIHCISKYSQNSLNELNESSLFESCLKLFIADRDFQQLNSTSSVCMLANLIHLASLNEEILVKNTIAFVVLVTRLQESCQKNMMIVSSSNNSRNLKLIIDMKNNKKKSEAMDVSFNPLLGWLTRERSTNIDQEIIKPQLSHLWSARFLKILFNDLLKANEKLTDLSNVSNRAQSSSPRHKMLSMFSPNRSNNFCNYQTTSCDPQALMQKSLFRRAIERATTTMTKTINSPYTKTTGSSGSSESAKLTTPEVNRISLVCFMLHSSLQTLTALNQEILTGLCLHDYILSNLWKFISSLGSNNGLKPFLEHLTIYTKTNTPEFHILILFCECASHLISILDDSELYEKQVPFHIEDLIAISGSLNSFVFRVISNNLIPINANQEMDPTLYATHKLLTDLYKRDCRRKFAPPDHWLIKDIKMSIFLKDLEAGKPVAKTIMRMLPHVIQHKERVLIFRKLVSKDKAQHCPGTGLSTLITIQRSRVVEDGYQQLVRLPPHALKGLIRVKFINDFGLDEAGIDQDGVFKEFLEDTIKKVFDPALNLFCSTSEQRLYPSPTSRLHEDYLSLFNFVGKMLGKAVYEGIVVDVPFASFFLSRVLGQPQSLLYSPIDELPSLDPELYKSLTYIKHYEGDVSELELTFSIDQDFMGKIETHELERGGKSIPVTRESRVRYIHSVANFRMKTQIEKQTEAFVKGFKSIINPEWLSMFSASEFQRLISGDNTPIDLQDLRRHTKYFGGFHNNHRVVCWLWDILEKDFNAEEHKLFLKFVTSCSKPPLLGFANLEPPFSIRCVEVSDDQDSGDTVGSVLRGFLALRPLDPVDRLPTSSTCFNLLKLPNYQRRSTLREKLRYAIKSNPGFELS